MTGLESTLAGLVAIMAGGIGVRVIFPGVQKSLCDQRHASLDTLFNTKLDSIEDRLERMEKKIDRNNNTS